jgi:hypothetical protein
MFNRLWHYGCILHVSQNVKDTGLPHEKKRAKKNWFCTTTCRKAKRTAEAGTEINQAATT